MRYREILESCWQGYRQAGMKNKGGRQVPNCVPMREGDDAEKQRYEQAARDVIKGADPDHIIRIRKLDPEILRKHIAYAWDKINSGEYKINRPNLEESSNKFILYFNGKPVATYPTKQEAEYQGQTIQQRVPGTRVEVKQEVCTLKPVELEENLRNWFKEKWVRFGPDGKIRGACARGSSKEGKPKCLPQSKAHSLGKKGRASAASRKRRQDPNPERRGAAINVATKKK